MKKLVIATILMLIAFGSVMAAQSKTEEQLKPLQPLPMAERKTLAVLPYETKETLNRFDGLETALADLTINAFFETQRFLLVERTKMSAVMNEMKLAVSGVVSSENAVALGKQLGASYIFVGSVSAVSPIEEKKSLGLAYIHTKGFEVTVQGRIIEIERGVVAASSTVKGLEKQTMKMAFGATTGSISPDETLVKAAFQQAIIKLTNDLASQM